jgi:hypothetical protein
MSLRDDRTVEEWEALSAKNRANRGKPVSASKATPRLDGARAEGIPKPPRVRGAQRTNVNGEIFDSKREAACYVELRLRQKAGEIKKLRRQVLFPLVVKGWPVYEHGYVADFVYYEREGEEWRYIVHDAKGHRTEIYAAKRRLMQAIYGIEVRES